MLEGPWVPADKHEDRMMEDIHVATRRAHEDGVSRRRIAACLAFMAAATLDPRSDEEPRPAEAAPPDGDLAADLEAERTDEVDGACPECGEPAEADECHVEMGGIVHLPCGHEIEHAEAVDAGILEDPVDDIGEVGDGD